MKLEKHQRTVIVGPAEIIVGRDTTGSIRYLDPSEVAGIERAGETPLQFRDDVTPVPPE